MKKICMMCLTVLCVFLLVGCANSKPQDDPVWPDNELTALIPKLDSNVLSQGYGYIDELPSFYQINDLTTSEDAYNTYVEACQEKGFDVDASQKEGNDRINYEAYNESGYHIIVNLHGNSMDITISAPDEEN